MPLGNEASSMNLSYLSFCSLMYLEVQSRETIHIFWINKFMELISQKAKNIYIYNSLNFGKCNQVSGIGNSINHSGYYPSPWRSFWTSGVYWGNSGPWPLAPPSLATQRSDTKPPSFDALGSSLRSWTDLSEEDIGLLSLIAHDSSGDWPDVTLHSHSVTSQWGQEKAATPLLTWQWPGWKGKYMMPHSLGPEQHPPSQLFQKQSSYFKD